MAPFRIIELSEDADPDFVEEATGLDFYAALDEADAVFSSCRIRPTGPENLAFAALSQKGQIVGAATYGNYRGDGGLTHTFSVAVLPTNRRQGIARALVEAVSAIASEHSLAAGVPPYYMVWVVNPHMARLLESMGFGTEGLEWSPDTPHMTRYYNNPRYPWMKLKYTEPFIPLMKKRGAAKVARSYRGFYTAFKKAKGKPDKMGLTHPDTPNRDPYPWRKRRQEFIARHMAQVNKNNEPLWDSSGNPTNRHLGLIAWAYTPDPDGVQRWVERRR